MSVKEGTPVALRFPHIFAFLEGLINSA